MKPFEHILILSDLDNTFLGNRSRIVPENITAIERFKSLGGKFAFATGRDPFALLRVCPDADKIANYPCIATNGAYIYDFQKKAILDAHPLEGNELFPIFDEVLARNPNVTLRFSTASHFLTPKLTPLLRENLKNFLDVTEEIALRDIPSDTTLYKAVFHAMPEDLIPLKKDLDTYNLNEYSCYFSCSVLYEVLDREGTKGKRVQTLKHYDPKISYTYGAGDHENDKQLLENADCGCCPENAIASIQSLADVHLCHCDSGAIADLISRIEHSKGGILL